MRITVAILILITSLCTNSSTVHANARPLPEVYLKTLELRAQLNKAMAGQDIDYQQLRLGYFKLYGAYIDEPIFGSIIGQLETASQYKQYIDLGGLDRVSTYADISTHDYLARVMAKHGNNDLAAKHVRVKMGLVEAIRKSSSGTTVEHPLSLISKAEMHGYLAANKYAEERFETLDSVQGKTTRAIFKDESGIRKSLYFRVPDSSTVLPKSTKKPPVIQFAFDYFDRVRATKDGENVDMLLLRRDQRLLNNMPANDAINSMLRDLLDKKDYRNAMIIAEHNLNRNFVNADSHVAAFHAANNLGDEFHAETHLDIANMLADSVFSSGDGSSNNPLVFYSYLDFRVFLYMKSVDDISKFDLETLRPEGKGPAIAVMDIRNSKSGETAKLHINYELAQEKYIPMLPRVEPPLPELIVELNRENAISALRKALNDVATHANFIQVYDLAINKEQGKASISFQVNGVVPRAGKNKGTPPCSGAASATFIRHENGFWYLNNLNILDLRDSRNGQCFTDYTSITAQRQFITVK